MFDIKIINWILLFLSKHIWQWNLPTLCKYFFFSNVLLQNLLQRKEGMLKYVHRAEKPYPWLLICFGQPYFSLRSTQSHYYEWHLAVSSLIKLYQFLMILIHLPSIYMIIVSSVFLTVYISTHLIFVLIKLFLTRSPLVYLVSLIKHHSVFISLKLSATCKRINCQLAKVMMA